MDWEWVGWHFGERSSVLSRPIQGPINRLWDYDPTRRELVLNSFNLSEENYPQYRRVLLRYKPTTLQAYPSTAMQLASLVLEQGDVN